MKNRLFTTAILLAGSLVVANAAPKDDVLAAAKQLTESDSYSWTATVKTEDGAQFAPGPTNGKTEKDGTTYVTWEMMQGNLTEGVLKGDKGAGTNFQDGSWQSLAEMEGDGQGFGQFMVSRIKGIETAAQQIEFLVEGSKELTQEDGVISGELTEDEAKVHLGFFGRQGGDFGGMASTVTDAKGTVKFWLEDGSITKYEFQVQGTVDGFNGATEQDRTTTVEIKDVDSTEIELPEGAMDKLS